MKSQPLCTKIFLVKTSFKRPTIAEDRDHKDTIKISVSGSPPYLRTSDVCMHTFNTKKYILYTQNLYINP